MIEVTGEPERNEMLTVDWGRDRDRTGRARVRVAQVERQRLNPVGASGMKHSAIMQNSRSQPSTRVAYE